MTRPFSRSCSTSSPPLSPDGEHAGISRRGLFTLSAAWAAVLVVGDTARATATAVPNPRATPGLIPPVSTRVSHKDSSLQVTVDVREVRDVVAIHYTVTNLSKTSDTYKLSYIDGKTNKKSRGRMVSLDPGHTHTVSLYGGVNRSFTVNVCPSSSGSCIVLGPVSHRGSERAKGQG